MSLNLELYPREPFLYSVLHNLEEGILITDDDLNVVILNENAEKMLGIKARDILGRNVECLEPHLKLLALVKSKDKLAKSIELINGREVQITTGLSEVKPGVHACYAILHRIPPQEHLFNNQGTETNLPGSAKYYFNHIVGNNPSLIEQKNLAARAARTISTVLITGESGTGKEIFAHAIHNLSPRFRGPFIKVNCAAVPENLLESELFGYAEGAFTGALKEGKPGKFELADEGTIFLDEIADMSLSMQAKLLRVLQDREVERVGGIHTTRVNVRVIAATNQDLPRQVAQNKFREDLFYRLNVIVLNLCPLRERIDDIPILSNTLLHRLNKKLGTRVDKISPNVMEHFCAYPWPGNIRELENIIERAINFCEGNSINLSHLPKEILSCDNTIPPIQSNTSLEKILGEHEKEVICNTLKSCDGNKSRAAKALDIHRSVLYRKISKYKIDL
ncbi:MAG: sigma 54-interacting transcriptional regulator [Syntrophomonas sp.]